jgi:hypothetical protein
MAGLWLVALVLAGAGVHGPVEGVAFGCDEGTALPPDCLLAFDRDLGPAPVGLIGEVGTGGVLHWCLGVVQQAAAQESTTIGGGLRLDPLQARVTGSCRM